MGMKLPYGNVHWCNDIQSPDGVMKYEDNDVGYLLVVDLHYPKHPHDHHIDYPSAPGIMNVKESMVSDVSKETYECYSGINLQWYKSILHKSITVTPQEMRRLLNCY